MQLLPVGQQSSADGNTTDTRPVHEHRSTDIPAVPRSISSGTMIESAFLSICSILSSGNRPCGVVYCVVFYAIARVRQGLSSGCKDKQKIVSGKKK